MMKKRVLSIFVFLFLIITSTMMAQQQQKAQKPVIMVVPEKAWCINHGYSSDGRDVDYEKALQNNDVLSVITKMLPSSKPV